MCPISQEAFGTVMTALSSLNGHILPCNDELPDLTGCQTTLKGHKYDYGLAKLLWPGIPGMQ